MAITNNTNGYGGVKTYTRTKVLPRKEKMTYSQAGIPEEESYTKETFGLKNVMTSTPTQRQTFVKDAKSYNVQVSEFNKNIKSAKEEVDKYNRAVEDWNREGRYQTITYTFTTKTEPVPQTSEIKPRLETPVSNNSFFNWSNFFKKPTEQFKPIDITVSKPMITTAQYNATTGFTLPEPKPKFEYDQVPKFTTGISGEPPKQNLKLLFTNPFLYSERTKIKQEDLEKYTSEVSLERLKSFGLGAYKSTIVAGASLGYSLGSKPIETIKAIPAGIASSLNPKNIISDIKTSPYGSAGSLAGTVASGYALRYTGSKTLDLGKTGYYKLTGKEVPASSVYDPKVLSGKSRFPTSPSTKQTIINLEKTRLQKIFPELEGKVVAVSGSSYPGKIKIVKSKAELGQLPLEDSGQYFASLGKGSLYFTGVSAKKTPIKFTLNPFAKRSVPSTYVGGFKGVKNPPANILKQPGFGAVSSYTASQVKEGVLFTTKRGMIGKGELKPQLFRVGGKVRLEQGTVEEEVIAAASTAYKYVGKKKYYTTVAGKTIPLYVVEPTTSSLSILDRLLNKGTTGKAIAKAASSYAKYSSKYGDSTVVSPGLSPGLLYTSNAISKSTLSQYTPTSLSYLPVSKGTSAPKIIPPITISVPSPTPPDRSRTTTTTSVSSSPVTEPRYTPSYVPPVSFRPPSLPEITRPPTTPIYRRGKIKKAKMISEPAFDTFVLDKGKWLKANKSNENYNYNGAIKLGADITDNSASRSFKIKRTSKNANKFYPYMPNLIKFYQPSKTGKPKLTTAYIEKTAYLIDTPGEKKQITAKGIIANIRKNKGVFKL